MPANTPPEEIDGAEVLWWAWSDPDPFFVMPTGSDSADINIHGLAICRYASTGQIYRFSCSATWETQNDSPASSVASAKLLRSAQYDTQAVEWQAC